FFSLSGPAGPRALPSFPTRRSSDLQRVSWQPIAGYQFEFPPQVLRRSGATVLATLDDRIDNLRQTNATLEAIAQALFKSWFVDRSEEHTSELQSRENLVCRLLLEKK